VSFSIQYTWLYMVKVSIYEKFIQITDYYILSKCVKHKSPCKKLYLKSQSHFSNACQIKIA